MSVNVEIVGPGCSASNEVSDRDCSTDGCQSGSLGASNNVPVVVEVIEVRVKELRIVLDKLNRSNTILQLTVRLLNVVRVAMDSSSSHFNK